MSNDRLLILAGLAIVVTLLLAGRLYYIQIIEHDELLYQAKRQQIGSEPILSDRGVIFDRNMTVLAYSKPFTAFYVSVKLAQRYKTEDKIAKAFSKITNKPAEIYKRLMASGEARVLLEKTTSDTAMQLKTLKFDGLTSEEEPLRIYPFNTLAAHAIGYADRKTFHGVEGVERECDSILSGISGKRVILRDPLGNMIASIEDETVQARPGCNVILTIDKNIQESLEEELGKALTEFDGRYASGIVMNPQTGEILAMANVKSYNPNSYGTVTDFERRNHAISDMYEPGSTFKAISLSALLEKNLVHEGDEVNVEGGVYKISDIVIHDAHTAKSYSVEDVFAHSSNIGMAKLGLKIDKEEMYKHIRSLGFGNETQVELPAETHGSLAKPSEWDLAKRLTVSYGYGISVTPMQMITAYCALINGGVLNQAHIVKKIVTPSGEVVKENQTIPIRRVISEQTSARMKKLFVRIVEKGTGDLARIPGMEVGGKTGTARMALNNDYSQTNYNASFIGFFPAGNPKYVCLTVVNSPKSSIFGREVASPVFRRVAERIITLDPEMQSLRHPQTQTASVTAPAETTQTTEAQPSTPAEPVKTVASLKLDGSVMPDLRGLAMRDAVFASEKLRLRYHIGGHGRVRTQSIPPGQRIRPGSDCTLLGASTAELAKF